MNDFDTECDEYLDDDGECQCEECVAPDMELLKSELALNVKRGVHLLDEKAPAWREKIMLSNLDISSGSRCILGQVYGDYHTGLRRIGLTGEFQGGDYGFDYPHDMNDNTSTRAVWKALDELWYAHLTEGI